MRQMRVVAALAIAVALAACGDDDAQPAGTPRPETDPVEAPAVVDGSVALRVAVFDETTDRPITARTTVGEPDAVELWARGTGSWYPEFAGGAALHEAFGDFTAGGAGELFVYPDGRDRTEIQVDLEVPGDVIAESVQHMISIAIHDDHVEVFGTSIPDFEREYPR